MLRVDSLGRTRILVWRVYSSVELEEQLVLRVEPTALGVSCVIVVHPAMWFPVSFGLDSPLVEWTWLDYCDYPIRVL